MRLHIPRWAIDDCFEGLHQSVAASHGSGHHFTLHDGTREEIFDVPGVRIWGKTGTATAPPLKVDLDGDGTEERVQTDHAWWVGFVGGEDGVPRCAISVILENGGSGGKVAGPIAAEAIRALAERGYLSRSGNRSTKPRVVRRSLGRRNLIRRSMSSGRVS